MTELRHRFESTGVMALEASALTTKWPAVTPTVQRVGRNAVIPIEGPLKSKARGPFLSYRQIVSMVSEACASDASRLILHFDSPGGEVKDLFEACEEIRALVSQSGKELVSFVEGDCCSAAYALALVAPEIHVTATSCVGSIGVIKDMVSLARANREEGIDVVVVTSGARKADNHLSAEIVPEAVQALQATIDETAAVFFAHCESMRPERSASFWRSLEAGTFIGAKAVQSGLATSVSTYAQLVGVMMDRDQVKDALKALADEGDEAAKKALAAMDGEPSEEEEEAPASEAPEDEAAAEGDTPADEDEEDKGPSASASVDVLKELVSLKRKVAAMETKDERTKLLASRADLTSDPKYKAYLSQLSLKDLRQAVALTPKNPIANPAAASSVVPTRGKSQGRVQAAAGSVADALDIRMGIKGDAPSVERQVGQTVFARMTPSQARSILAGKAK